LAFPKTSPLQRIASVPPIIVAEMKKEVPFFGEELSLAYRNFTLFVTATNLSAATVAVDFDE